MRSLYITLCLFVSLSLPLNTGAEDDNPLTGPDLESYTLSMKEFKTLEIIDMDGMRIKNFRFQSTLNARRDEFLGLYVRESKRVYYYVARPLGGKPIKSIYWRTSKGIKGLLLNGRSFADYWRDEQKTLEARKRTFEAVPLHKADVGSFYSKWAGMEGVSATYISKSMFKMIGKVPQIKLDRPVDLTPVIQSLDGLYMLEFDNTRRETRLGCLIKDIQDIVDDGYESLMQKREGDLATLLFIRTDGKKVSSFILIRKDNDFNHCQLVCMEGAIPQDELGKVIAEGINQ